MAKFVKKWTGSGYASVNPISKKLAEIFAAILDMPETNEEHSTYVSRQEFEQMKGDLNWVTKNLKGLDKSKKLWAK